MSNKEINMKDLIEIQVSSKQSSKEKLNVFESTIKMQQEKKADSYQKDQDRYNQTWVLEDKSEVTLRAIHPDNERRMIDFYNTRLLVNIKKRMMKRILPRKNGLKRQSLY